MYPIKPLINCYMQRVLPIVYDPSLSFQELLYKVLDKINEVIEVTNDTEKIIRETLQEWYETGELATMLKYRTVYQVTDYGIFPDTDEDLYEKLYYFLEETVRPTGGIVYFPAGTYKISFTICIPPNTCFMGAGKNTVIYFDETHSGFGVALTNAGSNIEICHMSIEHGEEGEVETLSAQPGGIGLSTVASIGFKLGDNHIYRESVENLYIHDIYSNSKYVLQTEPDSEHTMTHIICENIYAPSSLVSWRAGGIIKDIHYSNINCALIRCGTGTNNTESGFLDHFYCKQLRISDPNITVENGVVDGSKETLVIDSSAVIMKANSKINNCEIIGGVKTNAFSLTSINAAEGLYGEYFITNCRIHDFNTFISNAVPAEYKDNIGPCFITDCYITNIAYKGDNYRGEIKGGKYPFRRPTYTYPRHYYNHNYPPAISAAENVSIIWNYTRISGDLIIAKMLLEIPTDIANDSLLFKFDSLGVGIAARYIVEVQNSTDRTTRPAIIETKLNDPDGKGRVYLASNFGSYDRVLINVPMILYKDWSSISSTLDPDE